MKNTKILVLLALVALLFSCAPEVTVTFDANGGEGTMANVVAKEGDALKLPANGFSKSDWTFTGWSTSATGAAEYSDGADYTIGSSDVTLYAVWIRAYKVTFDGNGSEGGTMIAQTIGQGLTEALTTNSFTKTNYTFAGWSTTAGGTVVYIDGANYTMGNSDVTLYAVWVTFVEFYLTMVDVPVPVGGITFPSKNNDSETMTVAKPFCAAEIEVTWVLWDAVSQWNTTKSKGYDFGSGQMGGWDTSEYSSNPCDANHPVTMVNWRDAIVFCNALTQWVNETQSPATPLDLVYYSDDAYTLPIKVTYTGSFLNKNAGEIDNPYIKAATNGNTDMANCSATGFRLPTSAEWECVARWQGTTSLNSNVVGSYPLGCTFGYYWTKGNSASGSTTAWNGGDTTNVAVYYDNSSDKTAAVKSKRANGLGLYDVSGNVEEWSFDWDPNSSGRVLRGGGWGSLNYLQVGGVISFSPSDRDSSYGLRVFQSK